MKKSLALIFFTYLSLVTSAQTIKKATLVSVSLTIETIIAVPCDRFETSFGSKKKVREINKEEYARLSRLLLKSKKNSRDHIDTRGELIITFEDESEKKICFGRFGLFYDGSKYFNNKALFQFILNRLQAKK